MNGLRSAVAFLTRFPVAAAGDDATLPPEAVRWFPVVGALVGLAVAGLYAVAILVLSPAAAAATAVAAGVLLTGAFHEDGLADTMDAVGGSFTREDALRILRDPRHGTYGVAAIVLSLLVRSAALASLTASAAVALVPVAHAVSRAVAVGVVAAIPPAGEDGMGAAFGRAVGRRDLIPAFGFALAVSLAAVGPWAAAVLGAAVAGALLAAWPAVRRLGGITGDVLGAVQQAGEIAVLVTGSALFLQDWWSFPWWS